MKKKRAIHEEIINLVHQKQSADPSEEVNILTMFLFLLQRAGVNHCVVFIMSSYLSIDYEFSASLLSVPLIVFPALDAGGPFCPDFFKGKRIKRSYPEQFLILIALLLYCRL